MMNESGKMKLHSLLFDGEKELGNVKFFPGTGRGLTSDDLAGAAADALKCAVDAWQAGTPSRPPVTGLEKRQLLG
jgi:hypothetical protein